MAAQETPEGAGARGLMQDLADLLADVQAVTDWERLRGASVLPMEPALPTEPVSTAAARDPRETSLPRSSRRVPARARAPAPAPSSKTSAAGNGLALHGKWATLVASAELSGTALQRALKSAVGLSDSAARLAGVQAALGDCQRCRLAQHRSALSFGAGDAAARLVVVTGAPAPLSTTPEDASHSGRAEQMLDGMLGRVLGLSRSQVYMLSAVKCQPPEGRMPRADELRSCSSFFRAQLASVRPDLVLVLGDVACRALFSQDVVAARQDWRQVAWPGGGARALATFHPTELLRDPAKKRQTFEDLKRLRQVLDELPT